MSNPIVIDISHYQPTPDWMTLRQNGTQGVILKATEGASYTDPTFKSRWQALKDNGLLRSAYHFMRPGDQIAQMQRFIKTVNPSQTERLCLDYEDADVSFADLEKSAKYLLDAGLEVTVYGSNILVDACKGKTSAILAKTSLWQARYSSSAPAVPTNIWKAWSLWQYTDKAKVIGISGNVDGNKWNGDPSKLAGWFDSSMAIMPPPVPEPEPEPELPVVILDIRCDTANPCDLRITVNGQEILT